MQSTSTKSKKTFHELFDIILTAEKEESRKGAREVRKLLYSFHDTKDSFLEIKEIINNAPEKYNNIVEDWRAENFVVAISVIYYLHGRDNQPDFLFPWLFRLLQEKNGHIRHSAVKMFRQELGPLTVHLRYPNYEQSKEKSIESDNILKHLYAQLNNLLADLWEKKYKKYKYIDSLPACPYKSIQMILSTMEEYCGEDYFGQALNKTKKVLSKIKLKYFLKDEHGEGPKDKNAICGDCGKKNICIGAMFNAYSNSPIVICEDCTIDRYQHDKGYVSRKVAAARRRRMFDVPYLVQEMFIDDFLDKTHRYSIDDISKEDIDKIFDISKDAYNQEFTKEGKIALEEMEKQEDIEYILREKLGL